MIVNALTIDVEDYFQVHALSDVIKYEDWDHIPSLVEKNTYKILDILDSAKVKAYAPHSLRQRRIGLCQFHQETDKTKKMGDAGKKLS